MIEGFRAMGVEPRAHTYGGSGHWFAERGSPGFDAKEFDPARSASWTTWVPREAAFAWNTRSCEAFSRPLWESRYGVYRFVDKLQIRRG